MLSCPLCCNEEFADVKEMTAHLSEMYKKLRCPLCDIRFDNLMVMIKHLERGCSGPGGNGENIENNSAEMSVDTPAGISAETSTENTADPTEDMTTFHLADDSDNETQISTTEGKTDAMETISEDQYLDKNGQIYRRRVVKISNLWADLEAAKTAEESGDIAAPIKVTMGKCGSTRCPLCSKAVKGEHSLRLHLEVAHGGQTHSCCYCTQVFQSEDTLKRHVSERHSMPYSCVYCNKPFNNLLMAKKHVQCHKSSKKPAFQCELCHETAHTNTEIKRHYREMHLKELKPRDADIQFTYPFYNCHFEDESLEPYLRRRKRPTPIAPYKKGSMWYEWRGYTYHQASTTRTGLQVLRCWVDGCWAEVRVPVIGAVAIQGEHTHKPYTWLRERNELYNSLRRRCMTETTPIRIIYDEEALRYPEGARNLVFPEATMRSWQRHIVQKMEDPTLEITLENSRTEWDEMDGDQIHTIPHEGEQVVRRRGRKRKIVEKVEM